MKPCSNQLWPQISVLYEKIRKLEKLLNCDDSIIQQQSSRKLSLKQLQQRVERLERKVKTQNSKASQQLSTSACLKFLYPIAADWQNIGVFLNLPDSDLIQIESDYPGKCRDCVREMIRKWLKQVNPAPSWKNLAEAVEIVDPSIAERIVRQYC